MRREERGLVPGSSARVKFGSLELERLPRNRCRALVEMTWHGQTYVGSAEEATTDLGELRCSALAAGDSLHRVVGASTATFELLDIETVKAFDQTAVIVALAIHSEGDVRYSVGFCVIKEDPRHAAVRAVLNAANRSLSQLLGLP